MKAQILDAVDDLTLSHQGILSDMEDARHFCRVVLGRSDTGQRGGLIVLDFEQVVEVKEAFALATLLPLLKSRSLPTLLLANLSPDVRRIYRRIPQIREALASARRLLPLIEKAGGVYWLWLKNSATPDVLTSMLAGASVDEAAVDGEAREILLANRDLFQLLSGRWGRSRNVTDAMRRLTTAFGSRIQDRILSLGIRKAGHYRLPSGRHAASVFQSSLLLNEPELVNRIAMEIARRWRRLSVQTVISASLLGVVLAKRVAECLGPEVTCLATHGYPDPRPTFGRGLRDKRRACVLADVVSSGRSVSSLQRYVIEEGGTLVDSVAVIDATGAASKHGVDALVSFRERTWKEATCPMDRRKEPYSEIDPFTSMPLLRPRKKQKVEVTLGVDEFWGLVLDNAALREGHFSFNGHHFATFIKTNKILKSPEASRKLAQAIVLQYQRVFDCIVHPTHESAILLAQATSVATRILFNKKEGPPLVPASRTDEGDYRISTAYGPLLHGKQVLVLDDGANFGDTLAGIYFAVEDLQPERVECCVFVDRLTPFSRKKVEAIIGPKVLKSLFYLPFPAYHRQDCPICRQNAGLMRFGKTAAGRSAKAYVLEKTQGLTFIDEPPHMEMASAVMPGSVSGGLELV